VCFKSFLNFFDLKHISKYSSHLQAQFLSHIHLLYILSVLILYRVVVNLTSGLLCLIAYFLCSCSLGAFLLLWLKHYISLQALLLDLKSYGKSLLLGCLSFFVSYGVFCLLYLLTAPLFNRLSLFFCHFASFFRYFLNIDCIPFPSTIFFYHNRCKV